GKNTNGELGNGKTSDSLVPVDVTGLSSGTVAVAMGDTHACAITAGGAVRCWGDDTYGQLGDGKSVPQKVPVETSLKSGAVGITVGAGYSCALLETGPVMCWGRNDRGQVGLATSTDPQRSPVEVVGL